MIELKPCIQQTSGVPLDFLLCERTDRCVASTKSGKNCAYHVAQTITPQTIAELSRLASQKGYAIAPIEALIARLQTADWPVTILGMGRPRDFPLTAITKTHRFVPLKLNYSATSNYVARASAQDACPIFNILANVIEERLPFKPKPSLIGQIGTAEHAMQLTQLGDCAHNEILEEIGLPATSRQDYCERELETRLEVSGRDIIVKGHADCLLKIINSSDETKGLAVIDLKHRQFNSTVEISSFVRQMLIYGIAASQITGIVPEYYLVISVRSPFGERPGYKRRQKPVITKIQNDSDSGMIAELKSYLGRSLKSGEKILASPLSLAREKGRQERMKSAGCFGRGDGNQICFKKEVCDYLAAQAREKQQPLVQILAENNYVPKNYLLSKN
ncbi:MAG: hypothetical protein HY438_01020 [DPANN group archaeon]|nr:hypothetical protein [DPANN group archaeon]